MTRRSPSLLLAGLVALAGIASCRAGPDRDAQAALLAAAQQAQPAGHALYLQHCAGCHGLQAGGVVGPRLLANPRLEDGDYAKGVIVSGRRAMPGFGNVLGEDELEAVTRFVTALGAPRD